MKKTLMIAAAAAFLTSGLAVTEAFAFSTGACKACHAIEKQKSTAPAWKDIAAAYGDAETLEEVFKTGFAPGTRKYLAQIKNDPNLLKKYGSNSKIGQMTGMFNSKIKGHEAEAAKALFDAVKNGKF